MRREWRIMVESAHYSVPYQLIGETVDVCITNSLVRIFHNNKEVALHERASKTWEYKRKAEHAPPLQEAVLQCNRDGLLTLAENIGAFTRQAAESILAHPSVDKLKPVRHMLKLADKYSNERLENACKRACNCKLFSYSSIKGILEKNLDREEIAAPNASKVIPLQQFRFARDPADYKSIYSAKETFEEKIERYHPFSTHGNAMMGPYYGGMADQIMEEEKKRVQTSTESGEI